MPNADKANLKPLPVASLMTALRNADAAGDTEAATRISAMIKNQQPEKSDQQVATPPQQVPFTQPDFAGAAVIEPVRAIVSGAGRAITGGIAGIFQALNPFEEQGAGAETVKAFQEGAFQPTTEAGRQGLEVLGGLVQKGIDIANFPISGIAGLVELVSGQGIDQAVATIKSTQEKGISTTFGQRVFEETGSPLAATLAEVAPEAILSAIGFKPAVSGVQSAVSGAGKAITEAGAIVTPIAKKAFKSSKERISSMVASSKDPAKKSFENIFTKSRKYGKLVANAEKQGFDPLKLKEFGESSSLDKRSMLKMVAITEKSLNSPTFAAKFRASDVAGDSLLKKIDFVKSNNAQAGKQLGRVGKSLKDKPVDTSEAFESFVDNAEAIGIKFDEDFIPNFEGSLIETIAPARKIIEDIALKIRRNPAPDAKQAHELKKFVDEIVSFGKGSEGGLSGKIDRLAKDFRTKINSSINEVSQPYREANKRFSDTVGALDDVQKAVGPIIDIYAAHADKAVGTALRGLMSNIKSRANLMNSIEGLETVSRKYGGAFDDDIAKLTLFADELERIFNTTARTSLKGQMAGAMQQAKNMGALDYAVKGAGIVVEKARGINDKNAIISIRKLLKAKPETKKIKTN